MRPRGRPPSSCVTLRGAPPESLRLGRLPIPRQTLVADRSGTDSSGMPPSDNLLSWIELSRSALHTNCGALSRIADGTPLAPSVKANAYGHGLPEVVTLLEPLTSVSYLAVHSIEEAERCRLAGWQRAIMVLGPISPADLDAVFDYWLEPVIFTHETLRVLARQAKKNKASVRTHLKLETGTHRLGITAEDIPRFAAIYRKSAELKKPYGASTHFANIEDTISHDYADQQLAVFRQLLALMKRENIAPRIRHTAASAALMLFARTHFDLVRPGIGVYGHWPSRETYLSYRLGGGENHILTPTLSWRCRVGQIKTVAADEYIGYGCTYRTTHKTRIAVLPVGYYDGLPRGLSNQGHVVIHGKRAPIRGRVCMNLLMVDITDIPGVTVGTVATLLGSDDGETISAEDWAALTGTINYEILARLSPATPRLVID